MGLIPTDDYDGISARLEQLHQRLVELGKDAKTASRWAIRLAIMHIPDGKEARVIDSDGSELGRVPLSLLAA